MIPGPSPRRKKCFICKGRAQILYTAPLAQRLDFLNEQNYHAYLNRPIQTKKKEKKKMEDAINQTFHQHIQTREDAIDRTFHG